MTGAAREVFTEWPLGFDVYCHLGAGNFLGAPARPAHLPAQLSDIIRNVPNSASTIQQLQQVSLALDHLSLRVERKSGLS